VAAIHHAIIPQVWAVPTAPELLDEVKRIPNAVLMNEGSISGLNGLLLGVAKGRGFEGMCVMGEVPMYVAHFPLLYPRASKSVMQFLTRSLEMSVDLSGLDDAIKESDVQVEEIYKKIPAEMRAQLEKLRGARADNAQEETSETHEQEFMEGIGRLLEDIDQSLKDGGTKG
jgi:proteasome assembly chaperone (PAC2) family protein